MTETEIQVKPLTEAYLMSLEAQGLRFEVTDGEIIYEAEGQDEYVTGEEHSWIEAKLVYYLMDVVTKGKLGRVYPGDADFILDGEMGDIRIQRKPDVAFVRAENVTPTPGYIYRAPDLAIEIISPSQTIEEMYRKFDEYFHYGTVEAWLVIPNLATIHVWTRDGITRIYRSGDTLTSDLLPGLALHVADVFEVS